MEVPPPQEAAASRVATVVADLVVVAAGPGKHSGLLTEARPDGLTCAVLENVRLPESPEKPV